MAILKPHYICMLSLLGLALIRTVSAGACDNKINSINNYNVCAKKCCGKDGRRRCLPSCVGISCASTLGCGGKCCEHGKCSDKECPVSTALVVSVVLGLFAFGVGIAIAWGIQYYKSKKRRGGCLSKC